MLIMMILCGFLKKLLREHGEMRSEDFWIGFEFWIGLGVRHLFGWNGIKCFGNYMLIDVLIYVFLELYAKIKKVGLNISLLHIYNQK